MSCLGPFASVEDFAGWNCQDSVIRRVHTGAAGSPVLVDSMARFRTRGVTAGSGMILYNLTDGSQGVVTAVSETELTAPLAGGLTNLWAVGDAYLIATVDAFERGTISNYLEITASDIASALSASGQCDCAASQWGVDFLRKLNIIDALSFHTCGCRQPLSDTERQQYRNWMDTQLGLLRTGKLNICGGPGSESPAFGSAATASTPFAAAQIIRDRLRRRV